MSPHHVVRVFTFSSALIFTAALAFAQATAQAPSKPTTGAPSTGTPTGTIGLPNTTNSTGTNNNKTNTQPTYQPPIYLTGRVMLEDGTPPPESATIERVCGATTRAEGYTDSQGNFGIELGNESAVFQDASEESGARSPLAGIGAAGSGVGNNGGAGSNAGVLGTINRYQNCELRAKLPGYRSQTISLSNRRPLDDPNVGVILLHKEGAGETGTTISASTLLAPKDSKKAYERGLQAVKKNKPEDAAREFEKAVELFPQHSAAWFELGRIQADREQIDAARQSYQKSIQGDPKFIGPYVQLSILSLREKNWPELAELTDRAMRLDSFDYPQLFLFNAVANYNLHKFELAERSIKQAMRLDTQHRFADITRLNGLILLLKKDYAGAAEQFRAFLKMASSPEDIAMVRAQLTEIEKVTTQAATAQKEK